LLVTVMGDALALGALALFSCNVFIVRAASARLEQGLGFLIALAANVVVVGLAVLEQVFVSGVRPATGSAVLLFMVGGILSSYLGRRGYFRSVETMGPSRAAGFQVTNPVFALVFAWLFLQETLTPLALGALAVVVLGLLLTSQVPGYETASRTSSRSMPLAFVGPALGAAACYGLGNVARGAAVDEWREPLVGGFLGAVTGILAYLLVAVPVRRLVADLRSADRRGIWLWSLAGAVTIAGQVAVIASTTYIPIAVAVAISSAMPMVVIPVSVLLLDNAERVTRRTVAGAALVVGGVGVMVLT
jgi:drug/metabolite transporter (DMT)-like permease